MTTEELVVQELLSYQKAAEMHSKRLKTALEKTKKHCPITPSFWDAASDNSVAMLDMLTTRFGKLQDVITAKIFPLILVLEGEQIMLFRNRLNFLEKYNIIHSAKWWFQVKELRNKLSHEYPDDYEAISQHINAIMPLANELLIRWEELSLYLKRYW